MWNNLPFPPLVSLPDSGIEPASPASPLLGADLSGSPHMLLNNNNSDLIFNCDPISQSLYEDK